ncbi:MAG: hypothetical protein QXS02_04810 [Candidatus Thermoplasmatota archaeon]
MYRHRRDTYKRAYKRTVNISGSTASIFLSTNNPEEDLDILLNKAIRTYNKIKRSDSRVG